MHVCYKRVEKKIIMEGSEFGSQTTVNIVEKVIEVGELNEGNISAAAGK